MTREIANALIGYFETLYYMNRKIIALCGVDVEDNSGQYETMVQDIIQAIPRLVPYAKRNEQYVLCKKDGLLEYADEIPFLLNDYENILKRHDDFLGRIKTVRNKFEHRMHGARMISGGSSSNVVAFDVTFAIDNREITITARELIDLTKDINSLFSKIQELVSQYAFENGKTEYAYYRRLLRYRFEYFNMIFNSDILCIIGKLFFSF